MGMNDQSALDDLSITLTTEMKCIRKSCLSNIIQLEIVGEDPDKIYLGGACSTCGNEYTLIFDKETK